MDHPIYWGLLAATAVVAGGARLAVGRPLWRRRASAVPISDLVVAAAAVALLVFHCAAMFFSSWVDAVPFADAPAAAVRDVDGAVSEVAYWVPAAVLVFALRRVWPPALFLLATTLVGVGYTMFVPHALTTHLAWLAAAVVSVVLTVAALVHPQRGEGRPRSRRAVAGPA